MTSSGGLAQGRGGRVPACARRSSGAAPLCGPGRFIPNTGYHRSLIAPPYEVRALPRVEHAPRAPVLPVLPVLQAVPSNNGFCSSHPLPECPMRDPPSPSARRGLCSMTDACRSMFRADERFYRCPNGLW